MGVNGVSSEIASLTKTEGINPKLGSSDLGIDDFLTLLTAQLQNQNMFEPTDNTEFIAQMAQFSTLQQLKDLGSLFQGTQAVALMGKTVTIQETGTDGITSVVKGVVDKVFMQNGTALLSVNGSKYALGDVTEVTNSIERNE